jgi:hypothetical protein
MLQLLIITDALRKKIADTLPMIQVRCYGFLRSVPHHIVPESSSPARGTSASRCGLHPPGCS